MRSVYWLFVGEKHLFKWKSPRLLVIPIFVSKDSILAATCEQFFGLFCCLFRSVDSCFKKNGENVLQSATKRKNFKRSNAVTRWRSPWMAPTNIGGIHENLGSAEGRELKKHPRRVEVDHNMKQKHATHMQLTVFFCHHQTQIHNLWCS